MPSDWQLRDLASHRACQKSLCCTEAHMALGENTSIPGIKFPYWPEDFAVSSAGAHHPIYSSSLQSPQCQPLAETNDGQTPPVHKLCKSNKRTQQTAPNVCPACFQLHCVKCQRCCTHKASISLTKRFCWWGAREGTHCPAALSCSKSRVLWTSCRKGKKEGWEKRALCTALGL